MITTAFRRILKYCQLLIYNRTEWGEKLYLYDFVRTKKETSKKFFQLKEDAKKIIILP